MLELPPLSLYIHIPWCVKKCPYCDFNSHEIRNSLPEQEYILALCEDFDRDYARCESRVIDSIFIGGGTPSLFRAKSYAAILEHIQSIASLSSNVEITLEANPGTVEAQKFKDYRDVGINRLSLGIQSFDEAQLQTLGRIHDVSEAKAAIDFVRDAGFESFNLDLMHGLPGQAHADAIKDLKTAIAYSPTHISWYQLTIEPNTVFYSRPPTLPTESVISAVEEAGLALLQDSSYLRYEVSAFSLPGKQSRHNLNYWQFGDYIGIGAGAHGKITNIGKNTVTRTKKPRQPKQYLDSSIGTDTEIEATDIPIEFLLNALRTKQGFSIAMFECRTGLPFSTIRKKVDYLVASGLLQTEQDWITTTNRGFRMLNSLLQEFL